MTGTLIVSDLHLFPREKSGSTSSPSLHAARSLAGLLRTFPDVNVTLAGDIFDFTLEDRHASLDETLHGFRNGYPELFAALVSVVGRGQQIVLVPGNHDARLGNAEGEAALQRVLQSSNVRVEPWFQRIEGTHIEHGHQFDADNAFVHPLGPHDPKTEPLGTALMRRFVGPSGAYVFAHGHKTTLTSGLRTVFEHFGARAPAVMSGYFRTAFGLLRDAVCERETREREARVGQERLKEQAERSGLPLTQLEELVRGCAAPRHVSFGQTWMRLYFDRVSCALGLCGSASLSAWPGEPRSLGLGLGAVAMLYLGSSWLHSRERYGQGPDSLLAEAAQRIRSLTGAKLVIMGHTHEPREEPGYINLGSFTFTSEARRFLLLSSAGSAELKRLPL